MLGTIITISTFLLLTIIVIIGMKIFKNATGSSFLSNLKK